MGEVGLDEPIDVTIIRIAWIWAGPIGTRSAIASGSPPALRATGAIEASGYQAFRHWPIALISWAWSRQISLASDPTPGEPMSNTNSPMRRAPVWCCTMASIQRRS